VRTYQADELHLNHKVIMLLALGLRRSQISI